MVGTGNFLIAHRQSVDGAVRGHVSGLLAQHRQFGRADHFSVMLALGSPTGRITTLIRQLFERG